MYNNFKSAILDLCNEQINKIQNAKISCAIRNFLPLEDFDKLIFLNLVGIFVSIAFFSTGLIGLLAIAFMLLNLIRIFFYNGNKLQITPLDVLVMFYLLFAFISLMGSSEFTLSLKGFIKMILYTNFYFFFSYWIRENKNYIWKIFLTISAFALFEAILAIIQNHAGVAAISGWQDMSNINPEDVIARAYGTLKPYNPNLLAGFLVTGLGFINYFFIKFLEEKNRKMLVLSISALALIILAIFYTGCRGAYIALMPFFVGVVYYLKLYIDKNYGGFSALSKRAKNTIYALFTSLCAFILLNPAIYKRILSIFAMRGDSSISFRMNVYKSSFEMFLGNPLIGVGLGNANFREIYGLYMLTGYDALSAYNIFLETACEMGIFGLISFILIFLYAIYICVGFFRNTEKNNEKYIVYSILVFLAILIFHGLTDTIFYRPQIQILFWLMLGTLNSIVFKEPQNL